MRLLHTSDWHLGRTFHGASLQREQAAVIDAIVDLTVATQVDAVIIAGDLFDRAVPPLEAVSLFDDAVARLRATVTAAHEPSEIERAMDIIGVAGKKLGLVK